MNFRIFTNLPYIWFLENKRNSYIGRICKKREFTLVCIFVIFPPPAWKWKLWNFSEFSLLWANFLRRASEVVSTGENRWNFWPFHPYVPMNARTSALKTLICQHNHMCLNLDVLTEGVCTLHTCYHRAKVNFHILVMHLLDFTIFHKNYKCKGPTL